jgi:N-acylneuraminate cytidylyltransferase
LLTNKILAVIPARKGSKRLPGKNKKLLAGKPLTQWTIEAAQKSKSIDRVFVSTDCEELKSLSELLGVEVPFLRPESLAQDDSTPAQVIKHTLDYFKKFGQNYDWVIWLQPTSPLRTSVDIENAIELLHSKKADAVISVCPCEHSPLWANVLGEDGEMDHFLPDAIKRNPRSQALKQHHRLNGAIYIANVSRMRAENNLFLSDNLYAYKMSAARSADIDHELDFKFAEFLINELELS